MRTHRVLIMLTLAAGGLAACGDDDDAAGAEATTAVLPSPAADTTPANSGAAADTAAVPSAGADFNDADVAFAQGMIPHHEQAIEMADVALDPTVEAGQQVRDLATGIKAAQDPEIELMTGWLTAWGQPVEMDTTAGHDMSEMEGIMSAEEMDALGASTGSGFDTMWLEMMIRHHEGAIAMAETAKAEGSNADVLALADAIIVAQQAEIDAMTAILAGPG